MKKIIINLIILTAFLSITEILTYNLVKYDFIKKTHENLFKYKYSMISFDNLYKYIKKRPIENKDSNLKPIVILGCSFAYGDQLNDKQTFSAKMAKLIKNPIYNLAYGGWSIANVLYILDYDKIITEIKEPLYVIYVYTPVQNHRIFLHVQHPSDNWTCVHYDLKNNKLIEDKPSTFMYQFYIAKYIDQTIANYKNTSSKYEEERKSFHKRLYLEAIKKMQSKWKNTKYFILNYADYEEAFLEEIEKESDWEVINIYELDDCQNIYKNQEFTISKTDLHPNEKAWNKITKQLLLKIQKEEESI